MSGTQDDANVGAGLGGNWAVKSVVKTSSSMHKDSSAARASSSPGFQSNGLVLKVQQGREVDGVGCSRLHNTDMSEVKGLSWCKAFDTRIFVWI